MRHRTVLLDVDTGDEQGIDLKSAARKDEDLAEEGAKPEAVESAEFGSQAVIGDMGQAMSDEQTSAGPGAENTNDATQDNQAEAMPAEPATAEA